MERPIGVSNPAAQSDSDPAAPEVPYSPPTPLFSVDETVNAAATVKISHAGLTFLLKEYFKIPEKFDLDVIGKESDGWTITFRYHIFSKREA